MYMVKRTQPSNKKSGHPSARKAGEGSGVRSFISTSEKDTAAFAKKIAAQLKGGETLALIGELGAGKTAFTKGLAKAFGVSQTITSPTFVLLKVYPIKKHPTIKRLVHVDAYRIKSSNSLSAIGLEDFINDSETVVVIEWADLVPGVIPAQALHFYFKHASEDRRTIEMKKKVDATSRRRRQDKSYYQPR